MGSLDPLAASERHREMVERHRENAARLAKSYVSHTTTGWGESVAENVLSFGLVFAEKPSFTYGYEVDPSVDLVDGRFPRGFAFVYDWRINDHGFYTGAWCGFVVETLSWQASGGGFLDDPPDPDYVLNFSLQFEAVGIKDLPADVMDRELST